MKSGEALALSLCGTACNWLEFWIFRYLFVASGVPEGLRIRATVCCHVFRIGCRLAMGCTLSEAALTKGLARRTSLPPEAAAEGASSLHHRVMKFTSATISLW
jgi:hypothetical protein